jgi:hypothetical protein
MPFVQTDPGPIDPCAILFDDASDESITMSHTVLPFFHHQDGGAMDGRIGRATPGLNDRTLHVISIRQFLDFGIRGPLSQLRCAVIAVAEKKVFDRSSV